jgi:hypothetical protein
MICLVIFRVLLSHSYGLLNYSCRLQPPTKSFVAHMWGAREMRGAGSGAGGHGDGAATSRGQRG